MAPNLITEISFSVSNRWPTKWPTSGVPFHGGMNRVRVTSAICVARRRTSS
jgi:hypothetical protein